MSKSRNWTKALFGYATDDTMLQLQVVPDMATGLVVCFIGIHQLPKKRSCYTSAKMLCESVYWQLPEKLLTMGDDGELAHQIKSICAKM